MGLPTTQIELQKLLFFSHEAYLIQTRLRLVAGYFEAWTRGPVHPDVYQSFRDFKGQPITRRAMGRDVFSANSVKLPVLNDPTAKRHVTETVARLSVLTAGDLIDLSHAAGGPWHSVVESAKKGVALGFRITDDVILKHRTHSMLMRRGRPAVFGRTVRSDGELPYDESPFTGYGHG